MNRIQYNFYMFILYNDFGKKIKEVLNGLIPGLIREPQPVRVPVQRPYPEREYRNRQR